MCDGSALSSSAIGEVLPSTLRASPSGAQMSAVHLILIGDLLDEENNVSVGINA